MKRKEKSTKAKQIKSWEETAATFENQSQSLKIMKASRALSATEKRQLLGPGRTRQISIRLPEEDLAAVKEIAEANARPYQQLVVIAVQQFLDRIAARTRGKLEA